MKLVGKSGILIETKRRKASKKKKKKKKTNHPPTNESNQWSPNNERMEWRQVSCAGEYQGPYLPAETYRLARAGALRKGLLVGTRLGRGGRY
jgi:hypothetical protein